MRATVAMAVVRLALWGVPFPILYRYLHRRKEGLAQGSTPAERRSVHHIARVVRAISRVVPGANCLVQALTAEQLLAQSGYVTTLRLGVATTEGRSLSAHAWIEYDGKVILGGSAAPDRFSPLRSREHHAG